MASSDFPSTTTVAGTRSSSDETTISGYLQKKFDNANLDFEVEVINAGVGHATSTTEKRSIKYMLVDFEPDLFIMYDGWNDANKRKVRESPPYTGTWQENKSEKDPFKFGNYPSYRTPFVVYNIFFKPFEKPTRFGTEFPPTDSDRISEVISIWKNNWFEICQLGQKQGFMTLLTVQPEVGTGNKPLSPFESRHVPDHEHDYARLQVLDGLVESLAELDLVCDQTADLRNIFDNRSETIYIDLVHISDNGNEIVASRLFEIALPLVKNSIENENSSSSNGV